MNVTASTHLYSFDATYPLFGDISLVDWETEVLASAQNDGKIIDYSIVGYRNAAFGLRYVHFRVVVKIDNGMTEEEIDQLALKFCNELVRDTDVEINDVSAL